MADISEVQTILFLGGLLVVAGILSSLIATRLGTPVLLIFLLLGMLAGEDGPGGILFDDYRLTYMVGSGALAIILFDGGLRTKVSLLRGALAPALVLATGGVLITAALAGALATYLLDLSLLEGLLLGAIIASTDAAAVFFLMRVGGLQLKRRVRSTLEVESATNDPLAVFLTVILVHLVLAERGGFTWEIFAALGRQAALGAAIGFVGGLMAVWALNKIALPSGLQPPFVVAGAVLIYALTSVLDGSGFLAVYLAGLVLGNRPVRGFPSILSFHNGATWLSQIVMFLFLGLLVTPSRLIEYIVPALVLAGFLMLVARPAAVWLCLWSFGFSRQEKLFISWVGLRGAVSIFLAAIPVLSGVPHRDIYFNVAFVIVLASLVFQGWTVNLTARRLGLALPRTTPSVRRVELDLPGQLEYELVGYPIVTDSPVMSGGQIPTWARPVLVVRKERILDTSEAGDLESGDFAYLLAPSARVHQLDRLFGAFSEGPQGRAVLMGEFTFDGGVRLDRLSQLYKMELQEDERALTIAELFAQRFDTQPDIGDQIILGDVALIVRELTGDRVARAGLQLVSATPSRRQGWLEKLFGHTLGERFRQLIEKLLG